MRMYSVPLAGGLHSVITCRIVAAIVDYLPLLYCIYLNFTNVYALTNPRRSFCVFYITNVPLFEDIPRDRHSLGFS